MVICRHQILLFFLLCWIARILQSVSPCIPKYYLKIFKFYGFYLKPTTILASKSLPWILDASAILSGFSRDLSYFVFLNNTLLNLVIMSKVSNICWVLWVIWLYIRFHFSKLSLYSLNLLVLYWFIVSLSLCVWIINGYLCFLHLKVVKIVPLNVVHRWKSNR
jgi:hypothetical protein